MDIVAMLMGILLLGWTWTSLHSKALNSLPGLLHNGAWSVGLIVVGTGLMNYQTPSGYAWILIGGAIFSFNLGILLSRGNEIAEGGSDCYQAELVTFKQFVALLMAFGLGLLIYLVSIARSFGLSVLLADPTSIRRYSDVSYLEAFPIYGKLLFYLGPLCFVLALFPRFVRGLRPGLGQVLLVASLALAQVVTLQRTNLFICLVWACGLVVLGSDQGLRSGRFRISAKGAFAAVASVAIGLVAFQGLAVALGKTGEANDSINLVVDERIRDSPYTSILHYASSGIPAFGKLVESDNHQEAPPSEGRPIFGDFNPQTWGASTISGPLKVVPGISSPASEVSPFILLPVPTNVYTWLEPWYRDFRAPGVLLISLAMGLILGYACRRRTQSPEAMLLGSLLVGLSALSTFSNRYMTVTSIVLYGALWGLGRSRRRREVQMTAAELRHTKERKPPAQPHAATSSPRQ